MTDYNKKIGITASIGVLAIFSLPNVSFIINSALAALTELYPDVPYSSILMLSTITSLIVIPISLIAGNLAGKKFTYKSLTVFAVFCFLVGGMLPYFINGYYLLLIARAIVGIGVGFTMPLGNAIVMKLYTGHKSASMQGLGTAVMNGAGILFQTLSGVLCVINLKYIWILHLIVVIPMLCIIFLLPEPVKETDSKDADKVKLPASVYLVSIGYALCVMFFYPLFLNVSTIIIGEGLGTAALAGIVLSMYNIGGLTAGLIFGFIYRSLKNSTIPVCLLSIIIFLAIGYFGKSALSLMIAVGGCGLALFLIWPAVMSEFSETLPVNATGPASGVFIACLNVGCFAASPYVGLLQSITGNTSPRFPIIIGFFAVGVISVIWILSKKHKTLNNPE